MNKYIKSIVVAGIIACSTFSLSFAQSKHEVTVWGGGGLSTLNYKIEGGDQKNGVGGLFGFGYAYSLNDNWSLATGLELSFLNAKGNANGFSDAHNTNDGEYDFELRTTVKGYKEKQRATYLNIPLTARFTTVISYGHKYYVSGGVKIGMPMTSKFEIGKAEFNNSGYYPQWSAQDGRELIMDTQKYMGFGSFTQTDKKGNLDLNVAIQLTLEIGIKWKLTNSTDFYTGVYVDYGLNDIKKTDKNILEYNQTRPTDFINNSILSSTHITEHGSGKLVDKVIPLSLGLKLGFAFNL